MLVVTAALLELLLPAATSAPAGYTVTVPQLAAGDGQRVVELTFRPPSLITGAINTSLYDATTRNATPAGNGDVQVLNSSAAFTQNFFAVDEQHIFGQLLWYGGSFVAADGENRGYSMYVYSSDGGKSWMKPPQGPGSPGGSVPPGWLPTIDTPSGGWAFRPAAGESRILSAASRNMVCACEGTQCEDMPTNMTAGCGNCSLPGGCPAMKANHSSGFLPGSLPPPPWYNFSSAYGLEFTVDAGSGALLANLSRRNTLFYGLPKDRGVLAQCGSQYGKTFMVYDWNIGMQNAATLADGTLVTVLCLCQGDRYQDWIMPPLNFSMYTLNAFASTDGGSTVSGTLESVNPFCFCRVWRYSGWWIMPELLT